MKKYEVGQEVYIDGYSGFCYPSWEKVTGVKTKYHEDTGATYQVIICGAREYRSDTGECVKGPSAYFLTDQTR